MRTQQTQQRGLHIAIAIILNLAASRSVSSFVPASVSVPFLSQASFDDNHNRALHLKSNNHRCHTIQKQTQFQRYHPSFHSHLNKHQPNLFTVLYEKHTNDDTITIIHDLHQDQSTYENTPSTAVTLPPTSTTTIPPKSTASLQNDQSTKLLLNLGLLIFCFGFAAYSILNVDSGMTRGWTVAEKAMRIPLDNWSSYESSLNTQPIATKTIINVIIYTLGDWLSQTLFVNKNLLDFDAKQTMRNGLIGLCFGPLVHEYYEFSDTILPVEVGFNRLYKIIMDQTIYISVKCSIYIIAVNVLSGESLETGVENVRTKLKDIMFTAWKFWPLVHCVTYGVIPARHRILWVNCVDLIWNAILALKTRGGTDEEEEMQESVDGLNGGEVVEHVTRLETASTAPNGIKEGSVNSIVANGDDKTDPILEMSELEELMLKTDNVATKATIVDIDTEEKNADISTKMNGRKEDYYELAIERLERTLSLSLSSSSPPVSLGSEVQSKR